MAGDLRLRGGESEAATPGRADSRPHAAETRLKAQVVARHDRLYGARMASATLPPSKGVEAESDAAAAASSTRTMSASSNPRLRTLAMPSFTVRALNNLSYGATPQSIAEFNGLGTTDLQRLANWVDWQLDWSAIDDSAVDARIANAGYSTLGKSLTQLWNLSKR